VGFGKPGLKNDKLFVVIVTSIVAVTDVITEFKILFSLSGSVCTRALIRR
jgi:hypothetical protein